MELIEFIEAIYIYREEGMYTFQFHSIAKCHMQSLHPLPPKTALVTERTQQLQQHSDLPPSSFVRNYLGGYNSRITINILIFVFKKILLLRKILAES